MSDLLRLYDAAGKDGYPPEWHETIKHLVREQAGYRCARCLHPYRSGQHGKGEWSPCDKQCRHKGPCRGESPVEAQWRILTVHHLDGNKLNCRWWNLAALCQRCHLSIQGRVVMSRPFFLEHSEWFRPYAAGYYAFAQLGLDLNREVVVARMEEFLNLARRVEVAR